MIINSFVRTFLIEGDRRLYLESIPIIPFRLIRERGKKDRLMLRARLPDGAKMLDFNSDSELHILHGKHGDPSRYDSDSIIMRFTDLELHRNWITEMGALHPNEVDPMTIYAEFRCNAHIKWDKA